MVINEIIWKENFVRKFKEKHKVEIKEVEEVLNKTKRFYRIAKGKVEGEDVYLALGQTSAGRHLSTFFILKSR